MMGTLMINLVSPKCPMITQPPTQSIIATLLGAGRRFGRRTRRESRKLSSELRVSCSSAAKSLSSLRQYDRKTLLRKIPAAIGHLVLETYVTRPLALLKGGIGKRTAWFMITGLLPLLLALAVILVPAMVFDSPQNQAYYFFARTLAFDPVSVLPILIGIIAMGVMFYFPPAGAPTDEAA
jgi:hypothetical protein